MAEIDKRVTDTLSDSPPLFAKCQVDVDGSRCAGGKNFECREGYTGVLCSECKIEQFYARGTCTTSCADIEPRGVTTVLGIIGVVLVWIIINKSAGGECASTLIGALSCLCRPMRGHKQCCVVAVGIYWSAVSAGLNVSTSASRTLRPSGHFRLVALRSRFVY